MYRLFVCMFVCLQSVHVNWNVWLHKALLYTPKFYRFIGFIIFTESIWIILSLTLFLMFKVGNVWISSHNMLWMYSGARGLARACGSNWKTCADWSVLSHHNTSFAHTIELLTSRMGCERADWWVGKLWELCFSVLIGRLKRVPNWIASVQVRVLLLYINKTASTSKCSFTQRSTTVALNPVYLLKNSILIGEYYFPPFFW